MPKDRRNRIVLWGVVASMVVAIVVIALFVTLVSNGNDKWRELETSVDRLTREVAARNKFRTVPGRKAVPGAAWDDYSMALADVAAIGTSYPLLARFLTGDPGVKRLEVEKIVAERSTALELLHQGAQREDGSYPYQWQLGPLMEIPSLLHLRTLASLAAIKARFLLEGGQAPEAAGRLVDLLVYAEDIGRNAPLLSHLISVAIYDIALNEAQTLVASNKLTPEELAEFASRLETLDREFPRVGPAFINESLMGGIGALEGAESLSPQHILAHAREVGLKNGLSMRAVYADAFKEIHGYMRRAENLDRETFANASKEAASIEAEVAKSANPVVRQAFPSVSRSFTVNREALAHLRLVRAAAVFRATGKVPELDDPFGGKLFHKIENGKVKIWSVGSDGTDHGGRGAWSGPRIEDIVLEMPK